MSIWCVQIRYGKDGASDELDEEINGLFDKFLDKYGNIIEEIHVYREMISDELP